MVTNSIPHPSAASIPPRCDVVVIGGGPAGSSAATLLAREGFHVVVLEKERFPRPQVGESLLPHLWNFTDLLGVTDKLQSEGFLPKSGGIIAWDGRIHHLSFSSFGYTDPNRVGINVERDIFDDLLLRHSEASGALVFEQVMVNAVDFIDPQWPRILYKDRRDGSYVNGQIGCRYVVDASGHAALLARQFKSRRLVGGEKKYLGLWGYFTGSRFLGPDAHSYPHEAIYRINPVVFVTSFEEGWIWHITLREKTSVGLVINTDSVRGMGRPGQQQFLLDSIMKTPIVRELLQEATFLPGSMAFRPDYSYYSEIVNGDNFYCIGDAGAFVDPIFSQGVQAAFYNGAIAAWAIGSSFKNESRRAYYSRLAGEQIQRYYGFSRLLALGDFGGEGVDMRQVTAMMKAMPVHELELALAAAHTTSRSENLQRMVREAGLTEKYGAGFGPSRLRVLETVHV